MWFCRGAFIFLMTIGVIIFFFSGRENGSIAFRDHVFYAVQAGLEYALREIKEGGYPIVENKIFDDSTFTVNIDPATKRISVQAKYRSLVRAHSITTDLLAADCVHVSVEHVALSGKNQQIIKGLRLRRHCLHAVQLTKLSLVWTPEQHEYVKKIVIDGKEVFSLQDEEPPSHNVIDIADIRIDSTLWIPIDLLELSGGMDGKKISLSIIFSDGSSVFQAWSFP